MKRAKSVKILYTVYEGTPFWDAIVNCPIPNTTRLHEIVSRGIMTLPGFGGLPPSAGLAPLPLQPSGVSSQGQTPNPEGRSAASAPHPPEADGVPPSPFSEDSFSDLVGFGGGGKGGST